MFLLTLFFSIMFRTWTTCVEPQAKRNCIGYNEPGIWQDCWSFLNWLWMEPRIYFNFRELAQGRGRCWVLKVLLSLWGWNVYSCLNVYYRILVCPTSFEIDLQVWPNFYSFFFFFSYCKLIFQCDCTAFYNYYFLRKGPDSRKKTINCK